MEVFLSENAFISIAKATVETLPLETLGILIGLRPSCAYKPKSHGHLSLSSIALLV